MPGNAGAILKPNQHGGMAMKYAAIFTYSPDRAKAEETRPRHRDYLAGLRERGKLAAAGPFTDYSGALIVYEADSEQEARTLIQEDPFHKAGVFADLQLRPWNQVF